MFKFGGLMTTKQSAAAGATSEGVLVRGSTPNTEVVHAAVAGGKVSARAVVAAVKKPVRQATKPHDEDLDKLAQLDAEQDLSTQAVADGERGANALLHRVSMVEAGSGSGVAAGDSAEDGAEGADAAPAAAAAASGGGGGGIGTLPLVLGGLAIAGGGAALAAGGGKKNSPPTVTPTQSVTTAEDTKATITVAASDADSDPLTYTTSNPTNGTVQATGGTIVYTPKPDFNGTDTFTVSVSDGKNPPVSQTVTVTVTPVNDRPVAVADVGAVVEDAVLTGSVATNDSDVDRDTLTYTLVAPVAGLTLAANGGYTFNAADAAYQSLAAGQTLAVVANYTVSDGKSPPLTATSTLTVTVTGVNDAPTVAATQAVAAAEDATSVPFTVAATDIDQGDTVTFSAPAQSARGGSVTGGTGGNFVYVPLPDFNGADTVVVSVTDRAGAVSQQTVTFNVASNLAEVVSIDVENDSNAVTYDANGSGFTLGDNFKFTDNSARPTNARIVNFAAGDTIEVTGASSDYSFTSTGSDLFITFNNSVAGVLNQIVLPGVARGFISDEASAESALGHDFFRALTNPVGGGTGVAGAGGDLDLDNDANIATTAIISAAGGNFAFTENANVANNVRITGFGAGDSITVSNATAATYSFTSVGTDIVITANNAGVASQIVIAGVAAAGSFVTDEASAEASVGFNFFSLAAAPIGGGGTAAGTTSSQSIDNGSVLATFNAATGAINFTDDATKETNVVITNFTSNDRISVSGASAADYSFTDGDNGRDLIISFTNTQTNAVNSIVLDDALVGKSAFIFNYQSAAAALGFDFMVFG